MNRTHVVAIIGTTLLARPRKRHARGYCPHISQNFSRGMRDAATMPAGQLTELQKFLVDYYDLNPDDYITGYFGRLTQQNVIPLPARTRPPDIWLRRTSDARGDCERVWRTTTHSRTDAHGCTVGFSCKRRTTACPMVGYSHCSTRPSQSRADDIPDNLTAPLRRRPSYAC